MTQEQYFASLPRVHNRIPQGATWDGREELLVTAEEYEAARAGKPLPKRKTTTKTTSAAKSESSAAPTSAGSVNAGSR
jgi:hypothetical protein